MKTLVTIIQCRRVVLPHLFARYSLPMMLGKLGGDVGFNLIQHCCPPSITSRMETSKYPVEKEELVRQWSASGKFGAAKIIRHGEANSRDPALASWRIGFEQALKSQAELFLWMEDDAFVYDPDCDKWSSLLGKARVGSYRREPFGYIRNAHYVCTRPFVEEFLPLLRDENLWDMSRSIYSDEKRRILDIDAPRMEPMLTKHAGTSLVDLNQNAAARYSHDPARRGPFLGLLARVCPRDLGQLSIDFPDWNLSVPSGPKVEEDLVV
jgi:hypothetical protein